MNNVKVLDEERHPISNGFRYLLRRLVDYGQEGRGVAGAELEVPDLVCVRVGGRVYCGGQSFRGVGGRVVGKI